MNLLNAETTFGTNADGLFRLHQQAITSEFLDGLKDERAAKANQRSGELERVASVPVHVVELWLRQGRDVWNASARQIVQWLEADSLQAFITTPKRV